MLALQDRTLYLSALRPPPGYSLEYAVGTTYSLDLMSMLSVPLTFALLDAETKEGEPMRHPLALLDSLRLYAERTVLFCQSAQISRSATSHLLFSHLEQTVVPVNAPNESGVFHPKVWLLKYVAPDGDAVFRLLCLSRNLTTDQSWDTALILEGPLIDRERAFARNRPLSEFLAALPGLAVAPLGEQQLAVVAKAADECLRVDFEAPQPFGSDLRFWPMGIEGHRRDPLAGRADRLLVVSPFVSASFLGEWHELDDRRVISRPEELQKLPASVLEGWTALAVDDDAGSAPESADGENSQASAVEHKAASLHAKLFVADRGWDAHVWTGSANATSAAFHHNVEFLVELNGKRSQVGVEVFADKGGLKALAAPFARGEDDPAQLVEEQLNAALDLAQRSLGRWATLKLLVAPADGGTYGLTLEAEPLTVALEEGLLIEVWPLGLNEQAARPATALLAGGQLALGTVSIGALTAFVAVRLSGQRGDVRAQKQFVLKLPLHGAPADRLDQVTALAIGDKERFLRYLLLLLARDVDPLAALDALLNDADDAGTRRPSQTGFGLPLLEELLRSLSRAPDKLDAVERLVSQLQATADGAALIPPQFLSLWSAVRLTRSRAGNSPR